MSLALHQLLDEQPGHLPDIRVRQLSEDSRRIEPGDLFLAVQGQSGDGHEFAAAAVKRGAVAVLAERQIPGLSVPVVVVPDLGSRRGSLAARFYGNPSEDLYCVGVTGTNGKTSIAHYLADLACRTGRPAGYMGTIGWGRPGALQPARLTTEDPVTVQRNLAALRDQGLQWAVLEVSSHALAQGRVDAVHFDVAVFSNLSRDHLDYHDSAESYGNAKARLFHWPGLKSAVINVDDDFGRALCADIPPSVTLLRYGPGGPDVGWAELEFSAVGVSGTWRTRWGDHPDVDAAACRVLCGERGRRPRGCFVMPVYPWRPLPMPPRRWGRCQDAWNTTVRQASRMSWWILPTRRTRWTRCSLLCAPSRWGG